MISILLVEDDLCLQNLLTYHLTKEGYHITVSSSISSAKKLLHTMCPRIVIMDVNLPDGSGYDFCEYLKQEINIPIIFLTANKEENEILQGYYLGADDYITKPFSINIFKEKLKAILHRVPQINTNIPDFSDGHLKCLFSQQCVYVDNKTVKLAVSDFKLLKIFIQNPNHIFSKSTLLDLIWTDEYNITEHAITETVYRLRNLLDTPSHKYIKTVYGMGYAWIGENNEKL